MTRSASRRGRETIFGALACVFVMAGLPWDTWLRLLIWLVLGFVIYFAYGRRHSRLAKR